MCNVNDTRALIDLGLIVMSYLGQIQDHWHSQAFTIAHKVIGLSHHIHSFIYLSKKHSAIGVQCDRTIIGVIRPYISFDWLDRQSP